MMVLSERCLRFTMLEMLPKELEAFLRAEKFRPFDIRLNDGRAIPVPHSDFASLSPDKWQLLVWYRDGGCDFIDVSAITSLHFSRRNGAAKKKPGKQ
jgi:hypothetical protein